ncbi:uncharacterized protein LOC108138180 [Drosophila elegans]|uniref:uncharacterized protein LOC108138180 n=1 Tax=Drosophila elegans TaxID=30023 RepID=UPI0007E88ED8|nr:uncharacterized protein LOC108138180 [Drosophila elegans]
MRPLIALLLLIAARGYTLSVPTPRSYENYSVYRVSVKTSSQQHIIDQLLEQYDNYNLWHRSVNEVDIMVSPSARDPFLAIMRKENIDVKLMIKNVQTLIDEERKGMTTFSG